MQGVGRRYRREQEQATFVAWQTARFHRTEKLKRLDHYLGELKPRKQTPRDMLAVLKAMAKGGAGMTFRKVDPSNS